MKPFNYLSKDFGILIHTRSICSANDKVERPILNFTMMGGDDFVPLDLFIGFPIDVSTLNSYPMSALDFLALSLVYAIFEADFDLFFLLFFWNSGYYTCSLSNPYQKQRY